MEAKTDGLTAQFTKVTTVAELPPGQSMTAILNNREVAIFNVDGEFHALNGRCPHMGGLLGNGILNGCVVKCPEHGMPFDVTSGTMPGGRGLSVEKFVVRVQGADVMIATELNQTGNNQ